MLLNFQKSNCVTRKFPSTLKIFYYITLIIKLYIHNDVNFEFLNKDI